MIWQCGKFEFEVSADKPLVMGICNVTPDSFSDGGEHAAADEAVAYAHELLEAGAGIIDVGGESTRPGSAEVSPAEEAARVLPVVEALAADGVPVSVDTRHAEVARAALDAGACVINDVSGFRNAAMREALAASDAGAVVMHMRGEPKTMQADPVYADVVAEVEGELLAAAAALEGLGVARSRISLDPGVGFGKTHAHNRVLLEATPRLAAHGYPLMVAVSRKSYIGHVTGIEAPKGRDAASALCAAAACADGATLARVHDVAATVAALHDSRRALVALGSNIGDGRAALDEAVERLGRVSGIWVVRVSPYVESEPAYVLDQPVFTNAVCLVQTTLAPRELLAALQGIEDAMGRVRVQRMGPRTIDLDILDYAGVVCDEPDLTLPHPRILERDFVVKPLLAMCGAYALADGTAVHADDVRVGCVTRVLDSADFKLFGIFC